jgi:hypothetical protein
VTFAELKQELVDRGFDSLSSTRQGLLINNARAELDRMFLWPWREAFASGLSPLAIADLGPIEAVVNTTTAVCPLSRSDWRSLLDMYGDLSTSGSPVFYYVASPSGTFEVATYPVSSSDVIGVQYWARTPDLVNGSDEPASPDEAHYTIVDLAARRAYRDNDEHDSAAALQPEIDNAISQLLDAYTPGTADGPDAYVGVTGASSDW